MTLICYHYALVVDESAKKRVFQYVQQTWIKPQLITKAVKKWPKKKKGCLIMMIVFFFTLGSKLFDRKKYIQYIKYIWVLLFDFVCRI